MGSTARALLLLCSMLIAWNGQAKAVDDDELSQRLLARTMYHEARGEGRDGMLAIGWVIINRTHDALFPPTIAGVVMQRSGRSCQWSWVCHLAADEPNDRGAWLAALALARELLTHPPPDPTDGAVWVQQTARGMPDWGVPVFKMAQIGGHMFLGRSRKGFSEPIFATRQSVADEPIILATLDVRWGPPSGLDRDDPLR